MASSQSIFPPECIAARDSVLFAGDKPFLNTTYGFYSPVFPNPLIAFPEVVSTCLSHFYDSLPWNGVREWLSLTWEYHYTDTYISLSDVVCCLLMAFFLTIIRLVANKYLLEKIPVWFNCDKTEGEKFPEAAFRAVIYSIAWTWTVYVMHSEQYFSYPYKAMIDFIPGVAVPDTVYWLYMFELGLYVHSIYATLFIEAIRRDFAVQLIHHIVTLMLLGYSLSVRLYGFGILVLFMHDGGDALMETAKCCVYFKIRNNKSHVMPELLANIIFGLFVLSWILFRLYWLPIKAIYAIGHVSKHYLYPTPHYLLPNALLWILYVLHWYWFYFIGKLVIHVLMGYEMADNRDYDDNETTQTTDKKEE